MANKPRSGVDFFSRYVRLPDYEKLIRSDCGVDRMYAFVRLTDRIGDTGGYYTEWSDEICELFACDERYSKEDIEAVISSAIKRNFFDRELYEKYSILTSKQLQELYIMATQSRAYIVFDERYLLINLCEITGSRINKIKILNLDGELICLSDYISNDNIRINEDLSDINSDLSDINADKFRIIPQSKGKEIKEKKNTPYMKVKESKERERIGGSSPQREREGREIIRQKYGEYKNVLLSDEELDKLMTEFPSDWNERIERLSEYIASTGRKYKSHLATIRVWARKEEKEEKEERHRLVTHQSKPNSYDAFMEQLRIISMEED